MANTATSFPTWLQLSKEDITRTKEWHDLTSEVFEAVQQQLTESHVSYFSDLTDSEKILFLDRAAKLVRDGSLHQDLITTVSGILDRKLNEEVTQIVMTPANEYTKTQLLLQEASKASISLLHRWPDLKNKLFTCLNRPLPPDLRKAVWKMFLNNQGVGQEYKEKKLKNRKDVTSLEAAISHKCEAFLTSESSFRDLAAHPAVLSTMRAALCYRHAFLKGTVTIVDTDYLLAVPFLKVFIADSQVNEVDDEEIAGFIEVYFTFMESRPPIMKDSRSKEFLAALKQYGNSVTTILNSKNMQLATTLERLLSQERPVQLAEGLATVMRSYARCMFVGFLSLDVVCYIWDQYIVTLKLPSFHCIATYSAILLMLLKKELLRCRNAKEVEEVLLVKSRTLTVQDFQREIDAHFMVDWQRQVHEQVDGAQLPLVDPVATVGRSAHAWSWWFRGEPPSRSGVDDRRRTREEREEERRRLRLEQLREEEQKKKKEKEMMRERERKIKEEFEEQNQREKEVIASLERELKQEKENRIESDQVKDEEIRRLREELDRLRTAPAAFNRTAAIPLSPPSAAESVRPSPVRPRETDPQADELVRSLLGGVLNSLEMVAHGSGEQRKNLDLLTREEMEKNTREYLEAERELFERELRKEDWDRMDSEQRSKNVEKLVKRLKEKRYERQNGAS